MSLKNTPNTKVVRTKYKDDERYISYLEERIGRLCQMNRELSIDNDKLSNIMFELNLEEYNSLFK